MIASGTHRPCELLWHGAKGLRGIDAFFKAKSKSYKIHYRVLAADTAEDHLSRMWRYASAHGGLYVHRRRHIAPLTRMPLLTCSAGSATCSLMRDGRIAERLY
ncbi:MAG: hypothetical protein H6597_04360 [Flavobacteriales bacterium]|nr:hypothetical protein [Flavobacteriales bacterium]